jgi:hypothetical protein
MTKTKTADEFEQELKDGSASEKHAEEAVGAGAGALSGAALGAIGGPPGAIVGAILGGAVGAVAAYALEGGNGESEHEQKLDEEIGVSGGDIGVPGLKHPGGQRGTYSSAAMGANTSTESDEEELAEGPIPASE